jgi:hypothetical protein
MSPSKVRTIDAESLWASPYTDGSGHQLRLRDFNRLQEEPLNVGRGAPFLSRHFRPLRREGVAAFL